MENKVKYPNLEEIKRTTLVADIQDAERDLGLEISPLSYMKNKKTSELQEIRNTLWKSAYPQVGLKAQDRYQFNQEEEFEISQIGAKA